MRIAIYGAPRIRCDCNSSIVVAIWKMEQLQDIEIESQTRMKEEVERNLVEARTETKGNKKKKRLTKRNNSVKSIRGKINWKKKQLAQESKNRCSLIRWWFMVNHHRPKKKKIDANLPPEKIVMGFEWSVPPNVIPLLILDNYSVVSQCTRGVGNCVIHCCDYNRHVMIEN